MSFDLDTLVFDRTLQDVRNGRSKGYYNHTDYNRVANAHKYIIEMLTEYGYATPPRIDSAYINDIPRVSKMQKYCDRIATLCGLIRYADDPPPLPDTMEKLTYIGANSIEENLHLLGKITEKIPQSWFDCGQIESGVAYQ